VSRLDSQVDLSGAAALVGRALSGSSSIRGIARWQPASLPENHARICLRKSCLNLCLLVNG
jgi:hypothetical protein